ncbi:MAG: PaaI family thioesterase [Gammaproteobacteria bacterium]|nr:PaaI family thioesterase [Gammaproteobacteria bacterium]
MSEQHYRALQAFYLATPINRIFRPSISVSAGEATVAMPIEERFFHAAGAIHGAVYFKVLDDAAFFAANSLEQEVFLLTTTFTTYLTRPVSEGVLRAVGKVVNQNRTQFIAEAVAFDAQEREVARGNGLFVRSKKPLRSIEEYANACA